MTKFIAVAGNIATGKTTLVRSLGARLGWADYVEEPDKNPFLAKYYADPQSWTFQSQMWFLYEKAAKLWAITEAAQASVLERTLDEGKLFSKLNLEPEEYALYLALYGLIERTAPAPSLIIFLRVSTEDMLRRIELRGHRYEQNIRREFLEALNKEYEDWIACWNHSPVVFMHWPDCSPRAYEERLDRIVGEIGRLGLR
jgi:deoxyadenosine/deoxycytidine kinase